MYSAVATASHSRPRPGIRIPARHEGSILPAITHEQPDTTTQTGSRPVHPWPSGTSAPQNHRVTLSRLAQPIRPPGHRVHRQTRPSKLTHNTYLEDPHPPPPGDPPHNHHRRHLPQKRADLHPDRLHRRAPQRTLVPRRPVVCQSTLHLVPRDAPVSGGRPEGHLLGPVQPADLCPVFHVDHLFPPGLDHQGQDQMKITQVG